MPRVPEPELLTPSEAIQFLRQQVPEFTEGEIQPTDDEAHAREAKAHAALLQFISDRPDALFRQAPCPKGHCYNSPDICVPPRCRLAENPPLIRAREFRKYFKILLSPAAKGKERSFSTLEVQWWYRWRVVKCRKRYQAPSAEADWKAAQKRFKGRVPREFVRNLRERFAPDGWDKRGRKTNSVKTNSARNSAENSAR